MRAFRVGLLALLLAACTVVPVVPSHPPAAEITTFAFIGRLAVRQGETRHHANIDWRHSPERDEVLLTSPLGQGLAQIGRAATGAWLVLADGRRFEAEDWRALSQRVFGFPLPLGVSARWLLGDGTAADGWRVTVRERAGATSETLPTLIELEREDIAVRLKIDEWIEAK